MRLSAVRSMAGWPARRLWESVSRDVRETDARALADLDLALDRASRSAHRAGRGSDNPAARGAGRDARPNTSPVASPGGWLGSALLGWVTRSPRRT